MTPDGFARRARALLAASVAAAVLVSLALAALPFVKYAYRAPGLHVALNTADAVIALVAAYLVYGRYRQGSRVRYLLLASSLSVLAIANLPFAAVPEALVMQDAPEVGEWAPLFLRAFGSALFAAAAVVPGRVRVDRRTARRAVAGVAFTVAWLGGFGLYATGRLPEAVPPEALVETGSPLLAGHPLVSALQALSLLLHLVAAASFYRSGRRERDEFLIWLAAAAVLGGGARVNYLLFPSLYTDYLYTGDLLRLGFYLLLLVGAAREIRSYWSARVGAAVARGRRDALREVEDVVGQDLREAVQAADVLAVVVDSVEARVVQERSQAAYDRLGQALADMKREIAAGGVDEPFEAQLRDAVSPIASRCGLAVAVSVDAAADRPSRGDVLLSLAAEAVRGAGGAGGERVQVVVAEEPLRLVVRDDGRELGPEDEERGAGLERIRRRAAETGGAVTVSSAAGRGTTVTVSWL